MKMQENMLRLNIKRKIAIVLDTSDSAEKHWREILDCVENLISNILPGGVEREIYFLGNSNKYKGDIMTHANTWKEENKNRGSFIAPILEKIDKSIEMIVVIGSGNIFDLQDYEDTDFASRIVLVKICEPLKGNENAGEEISPSDVKDIYDPVVEVVIKGKYFMPYCWNNQNYKFELSNEGAILKGNKLDNFSILVQGFGYEIKAHGKTMNGKEMKFDLDECGDIECVDISIEEKQEKQLSSEDEILFREIIKNKKYKCPMCKEEHDYKKVKCRDESALFVCESCIYESLKNVKGFIIFNEQNSKIFYKHHPLNTLRLSDNEVALVLTPEGAYIFKFNGQKWVKGNKLENYYKTDEGKWIIYL